MRNLRTTWGVVGTLLIGGIAQAGEPPVRTESYRSDKVVVLRAKVGVTTHVVLDPLEKIEFVSTGVGANCDKPTDSWCVFAPSHGSQFFVKPKSSATGANNIAVATDKRAYSFRVVMIDATDADEPPYRVTFAYPSEALPSSQPVLAMDGDIGDGGRAVVTSDRWNALLAEVAADEKAAVQRRLLATPAVRNTSYTMKIGKGSGDIAPVLVYDDGRFTYFKYPNNREIPAVFYLTDDGAENAINVHMEVDPVSGRKDLLAAHTLAARFVLRRGKAVVGIWNEALDLDGVPAIDGTTVPGVVRVPREGEHDANR